MKILKKTYSQYEVYIEGLELNSKKMITQKVKVLKFCGRSIHKYEAIFNISYLNEKNDMVIMRAYGKNEEEVMEKLEKIILKNKIKFKENAAEEIFD